MTIVALRFVAFWKSMLKSRTFSGGQEPLPILSSSDFFSPRALMMS